MVRSGEIQDGKTLMALMFVQCFRASIACHFGGALHHRVTLSGAKGPASGWPRPLSRR